MLPQVDKYELPLSRKGRCACISSGSRRRFGPMQAKERQPVMFGSTLTLCSRYRADFESIRCRYAWDVQQKLLDAKSIRSAREFSTSLSYRIESTLIRIILMLLILQCIEFVEGFRARESFSSSKTPGLRLGWGSVHVSPVLDWDLALHYSLPLFPFWCAHMRSGICTKETVGWRDLVQLTAFYRPHTDQINLFIITTVALLQVLRWEARESAILPSGWFSMWWFWRWCRHHQTSWSP